MSYMTDDKPKCLIDINGRTLLEKQINSFKSAGINDIGIVTGYKSEKINKYSTHKFFNEKWIETQMVYSLCCAKEWLEKFLNV